MTCIKNAIILFFLLALHGCSHNKYMEILTGENGFYWDIIQDANRKFSKPVYSYFFDTNGGCIYYAYMKYPNKPIKRVKFDYGDVVYPQTWARAHGTKACAATATSFPFLISSPTRCS